MSIKKVLLVILLVIVIGVAIAAIIVDSKFAVLRWSPRVSYQTLVKPETRLQMVVDVPRAEKFIKQQLLKDARVPEWVLKRALPYEAALIITPDNVLGDMNVTLFINDQRLAPIIIEKANQIQLPKPLSEWFTEKMTMKERGMLTRKGAASMDRMLLSKLKTQWKNAAPPAEPLKIAGGHLVEVVLDNRDGGALAIICTMLAAQGLPAADFITEGRMGVVASIASLRIQADIMPDKALKVHLELECGPEVEPSMAAVIAMGLDVGLGQVQPMAKAKGIDVQGKSTVSGKTVKGDYTIPDFEAILASL